MTGKSALFSLSVAVPVLAVLFADPAAATDAKIIRFTCNHENLSASKAEFEIVSDSDISDGEHHHLILRKGWHIFTDCVELTSAGRTSLNKFFPNFTTTDARSGRGGVQAFDPLRVGLEISPLPPAKPGDFVSLDISFYAKDTK